MKHTTRSEKNYQTSLEENFLPHFQKKSTENEKSLQTQIMFNKLWH